MPSLPDGQTTALVITGINISPYSARGIKQTLTQIQASSNMRRTINGKLINLSGSQFNKYRTVISSSDVQPPAFDGIWPGLEVTVYCVEELGYLTIGGAPDRPVVSGSSRVDGLMTFYRPILVCKVMNWSNDAAEWEAGNSWQLPLEEV